MWQSTNVTKNKPAMERTYRINEIFYSLQGEGVHTGRPAVFVRFSGCNLQCPFCDTDFSRFTAMTADNIVAAVAECCHDSNAMIVLTGGEPSLQVDEPLLDALHRLGMTIAIETNGTHPLPVGIDWVTCSPKEGSRVVLDSADEVKVVLTGNDPELWRRTIRAQHYLLQPCSCRNTGQVVEYILQHPWWRLSLQTHKYLEIQ